MSRFNVFDLASLSWRDQHGLPVLAVFSLDRPTCTFGVKATTRYTNSGARGRYTPYAPTYLPTVLASRYDDVLARLRQIASNRRASLTITATFDGVIPDRARWEIEEARPLFRDGLFVVAEVRTWSYEESKPAIIHVGDPLIIGLDVQGICRLITAFDLTAVEQIIMARANRKLA